MKSTNGEGLARNAEGRRGAARPSSETPKPLTSATSVSPSEVPRAETRRQQHQEHGGIVVEVVERQPTDASVLLRGPFGEQGGLAVPGWGDNPDHAAIACASLIDQSRAGHRASTRDGRG